MKRTSSLSAINYEEVQRSDKKKAAHKSCKYAATKHFNLFFVAVAFNGMQ